MIKYYEKNGEQVSGEVVNGQLITTMTVGGVVVSNPLITDIESDGWVEYTPIPAGSGNVQVTPADWSALITAVNQLTGNELVYADTAPDITTAITALRNGVTFANVAKWWSLPTLLCERKTIITAVSDSSIETVGDFAFQNATALTSVNFPNCTYVGNNAFQYCGALTSVNLPNCTSVGSFVFSGCTYLTRIELPELVSISWSVFQNCTSAKIISLPKLVNANYASMFQNLTSLNSLYIPLLTNIDGRSFLNGSNNIRSLDISSAIGWRNENGYMPASITSHLYRIHINGIYLSSINLAQSNCTWNPTEAVDANSTSLVPQQEWDIDENGDPIDCTQFTSNRDKFLYCFKHLFMPAFGTVSNQTLTLKSTVYDVVMNDNEVSTYFSTCGWTVARVA